MIPGLVEAALRALVVALSVWGGLRVFRVSNVLAQKAVWVLMLAAAAATPALMHRQWLPTTAGIRVPVSTWKLATTQAIHRAALAASLQPSPVAVTPQFAAILRQPTVAANRLRVPTVSHSEFNPRDQVRPIEQELVLIAPIPASHVSSASSLVNFLQGLKTWPLIEGLYFGVFGGLILRMSYGIAGAVRIWSNAEVVPPHNYAGLGIEPGDGLRVRSSSDVSSPVTIGACVVLPADYVEWDVEKLRIVLAHELSHVRQGDFYLQLLAAVYAAVFWFSPLGWWLKRKLSDLGEAISDHAGLQQAVSSASYARILLEFAALPRPTATGVAMARTTNLSHRIERLLNESKFRSAFAGSRGRVLLASLLVPVALFAGTALIRVEAASSAHVAAGQAVTPPTAPVAPVAAPEAAEPAEMNAVPPAPVAPPPPIVPVAPIPPVPPAAGPYGEIHDQADEHTVTMSNVNVNESQDASSSASMSASSSGMGHSYSVSKYENGKHTYARSAGPGYSYSYSSNGDSWALITDRTGKVTFSGDWDDGTRDTIDKVRKLTSGKFLWFKHDGKSYFIDDPGTIAEIEALYKPMEELGHKQEELGKQQEALGRQQEELGRKQEQVSIPTPDVTKEMAKLNEMAAKLEAKKGGTVSQEELADLEGKLGDLQGRLGELQGKIGEQQGRVGEEQGALGEKQGKLGEQQGKLGEEQGKIAEQADRKVKSTIDESLKDGKAKPVD